jgi:hypothetical protein
MVRESYIAADGSAIHHGELIHRKHPDFRQELCEPAHVTRDVEQMTASPGQKRRIRVAKG